MGRTKYPQILSAIKAEEGSKWDIADAILAEAGTANSAMHSVAEDLREQGYEWKPDTLAHFARTAQSFPHAARQRGVSFEAHIMAVDQATMKEAIRQNGGDLPTKRFVISVRKAMVAEKERLADEAREEAKAKAEKKAKQERKQADRQRKEAEEAQRKAKTDAEKAEARKKAHEAKKAEKEAEKAEKEAKRAPKGGQNVPDPGYEAIEHTRLVFEFDKAASEAQRMAEKATRIAKKGNLSRAEMEDSILSTVEAWEAVRDYRAEDKPKLRAVS